MLLEVGDQRSEGFRHRSLPLRAQRRDVEAARSPRERIADRAQVTGILGNGGQRRGDVCIASKP